jgi:3-oxoadipate enol-lactonase
MSKSHTNGIELYYEVQGTGQPLVLIHGLGSSTRDWEFQVPELSKNYQVITFDLRGHGKSDKPMGPYSISMFASDTAGLLKALGLESAHFVGISLGGGVAFQLAIDAPALVKTLVIVNSGPSMGGTPDERKKEFDSRVAIVKQMGMSAMGQALAPRLFPKSEHASLRDTFVARWAENDPRAYIDALLSMADWDVTNQLGSIRCPTLVIAADQDYTPVASKEAYVRLMPNAELVVIPEAHHATPIEQPQAFNVALKQFLGRHSERALSSGAGR